MARWPRLQFKRATLWFAGVLWVFLFLVSTVRSFWSEDWLILRRDPGQNSPYASVKALSLCRGWFLYHERESSRPMHEVSRAGRHPLDDTRMFNSVPADGVNIHLGSLAPKWEVLGVAYYYLQPSRPRQKPAMLIRVHMIYLLAPLLILPLKWGVAALRRRTARSRSRRGECSMCGYSLQGTPDADRCPECGREITEEDRRRIAVAVKSS